MILPGTKTLVASQFDPDIAVPDDLEVKILRITATFDLGKFVKRVQKSTNIVLG